MTTRTKKATRSHLIRAAKKGQLWVKCRYHMTDDYAFDAANKNGTMDEYKRAYLIPERESSYAADINAMYDAGATHADVEPLMEKQRDEYQGWLTKDDKASEGMIKFRIHDFRSKSGHVHGTTQEGNFTVHSNLSYDYQIRS